nr:patellin-6 [Tanacetum cinerariifolium]
MLIKSLEWRKAYGADFIVEQDLGFKTLENRVCYNMGCDRQGRSICYTDYTHFFEVVAPRDTRGSLSGRDVNVTFLVPMSKRQRVHEPCFSRCNRPNTLYSSGLRGCGVIVDTSLKRQRLPTGSSSDTFTVPIDHSDQNMPTLTVRAMYTIGSSNTSECDSVTGDAVNV